MRKRLIFYLDRSAPPKYIGTTKVLGPFQVFGAQPCPRTNRGLAEVQLPTERTTQNQGYLMPGDSAAVLQSAAMTQLDDSISTAETKASASICKSLPARSSLVEKQCRSH